MGDKAVLFGKTSEAKHGVFNAIDPRVIWPGLDQPTTEWSFVGSEGDKFAAFGDSGAWVLNTRGALGGMLIGGPKGIGHEGIGYVTPIVEVWKDIKAQTGYDVSLL